MNYFHIILAVLLSYSIVLPAYSLKPMSDDEVESITLVDESKMIIGGVEFDRVDFPKGSIRLVSIAPDLNKPLSIDSVIVSKIEYKVAETDLSKIRIFAQVKTNTKGRTFNGDNNNKEHPEILSNVGVIDVELPVSDVWGMRELKLPISLNVVMTFDVGKDRSKVIAYTEFYQYLAE